jgi:hypothetical protein
MYDVSASVLTGFPDGNTFHSSSVSDASAGWAADAIGGGGCKAKNVLGRVVS